MMAESVFKTANPEQSLLPFTNNKTSPLDMILTKSNEEVEKEAMKFRSTMKKLKKQQTNSKLN